MLFSSLTFIYMFLPLTLGLYYIAPKRLKNAVLLIASAVFYFYGEPRYTLLLLFSAVWSYIMGLAISRYAGKDDMRRAKAMLILCVAVDIALLAVFKYADFAIGAINGIFGSSIPLTRLPLPIGISFFTFQTISYNVDVYRKKARVQRNIVSLAAYVCLFPQLVAGPIVRYTDVERELNDRSITWEGVSNGVVRFSIGLGKKVLIANLLGELSTGLLSLELSVAGTWAWAVCYMLQIYYDFSGYSDMAIGLGRMMGFEFPENFDHPFISQSITEFWRRWHMTLGGWFRDYLYIPLGGSRRGTARLILNIAVVWTLTGLWHGASWNFVLWGAYFAVLLTLEKLLWGKAVGRLPSALRHIYALVLVAVSFVIFGSETDGTLLPRLSAMFGGAPVVSAGLWYELSRGAVVLTAAIIGAVPLLRRLALKLSDKAPRVMTVLQPAVCCVLLLVCTAMLVDSSFNPFLYFRF